MHEYKTGTVLYVCVPATRVQENENKSQGKMRIFRTGNIIDSVLVDLRQIVLEETIFYLKSIFECTYIF